MVVLIKRYINRKFYDTYHKRYVTLKDIGNLVGIGEDIQVVDHVTGDDITEIILRRVIFQFNDICKTKCPETVLAQLKRKSSDMSSGVFGYCYDCYLSALDDIKRETRRTFMILVENGELSWHQAEELIRKLFMSTQQLVHEKYTIMRIVRESIRDQLATRDEFQLLSKKVDTLANEVEELVARVEIVGEQA